MKIDNSEKLVSILMTSYNREKYIADAIQSVLNSTYKNFELIICDDASTDRTVAIARDYGTKDNRIKVYVNEENLGQFQNRNRAASYASGKYLKYLDSDDTIFDWGLAYCVEMMERHPEAGMGILKLNKEVKEEYLVPRESIYKHFFEYTILNIGPSGTIMKTEAFQNLGQYTSDYGVPSDMYFNLKLAASYPIVLLNQVFFFYRIHDGQEFTNKYSYVCYNYKYLADALQLKNFPLTEGQKQWLLKNARRSFVRQFLIYIRDTKNILKAIRAIKLSGIGFKGFFRGVLR